MRHPWTCAFGLALTVLPVSADTAVPVEPLLPGQDPQLFIQKGVSLERNGDLDGAIDAFDKALQLDPKSAAAYEGRGEIHIKQGELTDGIADFSKALESDPNFDAAFYHRGLAEENQGDFDAAIADFGHTIELKPQSDEAYQERARTRFLKGDNDGAIADAGEALLLNPHYAAAYFTRGLAQFDKGHNVPAASDFEKAALAGMPEAALWYWAVKTERNQNQDLESKLAELLAPGGHPNPWISELGDFLLEKTTDTQLLADAQKGKPGENRPQQAWFFIGLSRSFSGDSKGAQDALNQSLTVGDQNSHLAVEARRMLKHPSPSP